MTFLQGNDEAILDLSSDRPQIIGHRGSGLPAYKDGEALEENGSPLLIGNTASAIRKAIEANVDWIEIDIRASSDNELIVYHDETLNLKTNASNKDEAIKVEDLNKQALQNIQLLVKPPENILTLEDVFSEFHSDQRKWIFDIKTTGIQEEILSWIEHKVSSGELSDDQFILFGSYNVLLEYKESGYNLGYTVTWGNEEGLTNRMHVLFTPSKIINRCETLGCHVLVLPTIFANQSLINTARSEGFAVWVYGSDNILDHQYFSANGVSGLIVDDPQKAMDCFEGRSPKIEPFGAKRTLGGH
ncbi:MAG: glycerophosphodiester phosphodiesterase [Akkermansiaceae bacterium]|nr:glycerophosphodiester phosphodiesterase [Akkermansiaceae bacterium]MDP4647772.1 glycerophosphodiester phosphodiesterase [Akkermansiaceae bacterium]MDP4722176.1 glycerophosphodiester phosphodiesterase [Akkermansiaceae bacterium]MDP4780847.1 glycerophosphodiester phosphodiesterase [Akkermansiaceae bacterium]MDP4848421.1 glycerophosphodiester phosphodiesterase [Akkermansiaceae bacterium]